MTSEPTPWNEPPPSLAEPPTRVRYVVLSALAMAAILAYVLRSGVATASTTIQRDLELGDVWMGYVLSGFFLGYFWFQIPAGWLGSRLGARTSLVAMGLLWAGAMAMTAAARDGGVLIASRLLQGAAQAGMFSVIIMAVADWFPPSRRGFASSVITGSMSVGAVIASGLTGRLLGPLGWRATFLWYAAVVVAWAAGVGVWFRNRPEEHPGVNASEAWLIRREFKDGAGAGSRPGASPKPQDRQALLTVLSQMIRSPSMWALNVQAFFRAFGYAFFITWFPTYLEKGRGVNVSGAGDLTMIPLIGVVLGSFAGGAIVDAVLVRTGSRRLSRCAVSAVSLALCGVATLSASWADQPLEAVLIISLGSFFSGFSGPTTWAATMDLSGRETAVGFAVMNMAGNLGAVVCPVVLGYLIHGLVQTGGDWNLLLYLFAAVYFAGAFAWLLLDPEKPAVA
ncbi:MAG: MFS transporter [Isosphaeraceae bacterium]